MAAPNAMKARLEAFSHLLIISLLVPVTQTRHEAG
jgi:hypothetical protein